MNNNELGNFSHTPPDNQTQPPLVFPGVEQQSQQAIQQPTNPPLTPQPIYTPPSNEPQKPKGSRVNFIVIGIIVVIAITAMIFGLNTLLGSKDKNSIGSFENSDKNSQILKKAASFAVGAPENYLVIDSDGYLWSWGRYSSPQKIGDKKYMAVSVGDHYNYPYFMAIDTDGYLWAWGSNYEGRLGLGDNGTESSYDTPQKVGEKKYTAISVGPNHVLALDIDGYLWAWGDNGGKLFVKLGLGDSGTESHYNSPQKVGDKQYVDISASERSSYAIDTDGYLWAWGDNQYYQLGIGEKSNYGISTPQKIGDKKYSVVAAGSTYALALDTSGNLWSWGYDEVGKLGLGTKTEASSPQQIGNKKYIALTAGSKTMYSAGPHAIDTDGYLWSWGYKASDGEITRSDDKYRSLPQKVGNTKYIAVTAGGYNALAISSDGELWSWRQSDYDPENPTLVEVSPKKP
jgi:hypothetical protein